MSFRIAMQARRAVSSLCRPHEIIDHSTEILIAERRHGRDEHLFLSEASPCAMTEGQAPDRLQPRHVLIGTLVSRGPEPLSETFMLDRHIPNSAEFGGLFLPADGYLHLSQSAMGLAISGVCRLTWAARSAGGIAGQSIARALCDTPELEGCVLHIEATYIPWAQETLPHDVVTVPIEGERS